MPSAETTAEAAALAKQISESDPRGPTSEHTRFQLEDEPKETEVLIRDPSFGSSLLYVS